MATTESKLFKLTNIKKVKHQKRKIKSKKKSLQLDFCTNPYVTPKSSKIDDINNFWTYSPRNPFDIQKFQKFKPSKCVTVSTTSYGKNKDKIPPRFTSFTSGNMSSIVSRRENDNTAAVIEARREIEKIKAELETLINTNIKTQPVYTESTSLIPPEIESLLSTAADACNTLADTPEEPNDPLKTTTPIPTIRSSLMSPITSTRKKIAPPIPEEAPPPIEPPRLKSRPYDPEKTREFIKKQKLRRKEKLLEEEQNKQQKEYARKNKLEELKKKTLELVSNNLKKSTSKSAKPPSDLNTKNTSKSIAQIDNNNKKVNKFLLQSKRCRARSFDDVNRDKETKNKRTRSVSREIISTQSKQKIPENQSLAGTKSQSSSQKSLTPKLTKQPPQKKETTKIDSPPKIIESNETSSTKKNIKSESPLDTKQKNISIHLTSSNNLRTKQNDEYETNAAKELTEIKQKLETSITQLKEKNEIPVWLQPPSAVPYPYNFISAVRKKLEYVTRKPNKIDKNDENNKLNVSVQCSIDKQLDVPFDKKKLDASFDKKILDVNSVNIPKLKSPIKLESPRNRTYESHKCRRQLYPNINIPQTHPTELKTNEIEININKTDSDSDTAKNIPELPHEETVQPINNTTKTKNITFDKSKDNFSRDSSKFSLAASDISNRLKNNTFERNIPPKLNIGDIKLPQPEKYVSLIPPNDKIEIPPKNTRKSRSKYPDDIDSILSHYSKIKSEQNSYSDDFTSISGSASSKPEKRTKTESVTEYKEIPSFSKTATSISEHVPRTHSNSSSKENISEANHKKTYSKSRTVSTETNVTMKGVPSLPKQSDSVVEATTIDTDSNQIKTDSSAARTVTSFNLNNEESEEKFVDVQPELKKLTKPEVFLKRRADEIENNPNHIHLKLQAEVHLLNSFNNSLKQVVAVEKSVFEAPSTSNFNAINCKRGCDFPANDVFNRTPQNTSKIKNFSNTSFNNFSNTNFKENDIDDDDTSVCSQDLGMSNIIDRSSISTTFATNSVISRRGDENLDLKNHPYVAISLDMVDQMIKDEDIRLEHLKAVLKLRDQALFDRIKGELALLEIRKRKLRDTGQTNDITAIKKKQRGLIIKLQQERHEMQRLKTAHKQAAKARKTALHEQKSIIKTQLSSTDQIPKKLRRLSQLERPSLGPIKVYRVDSKTEFSETTVSRKGSDDSVTNSSVLTQISEKISVEKSEIFYSDSLAVVEPVKNKHSTSAQSEKLKRSLLMKEAEIDKRRKEIEELIKWQKRLKQKEAEVVELERQAVKSLQSDDQEKVRVFTGAHLNKVWKGIALPDKNFDEQKKYQMSKRSLDKFYQNARKMFKEVSDEEKRSKTESYSSEFEQTNSTSRLDHLSNSVVSLMDVEVQTKMVAERLRHISDIISVPDTDNKSNTSSEDISSIQEDNKSVSVSESQSVKTEVNTLVNKSDSKIESIRSEFIDSLQNKSLSKSLELLIASENSARKPEESNSIVSESMKTDSLEKTPSKSLEYDIVTENSSQKLVKSVAEILESLKSDTEEKLHSTSIVSENSTAKSILEASEPQIQDSLNSSVKSDFNLGSISEASDYSKPQVSENIVSESSSAKLQKTEPPVLENIDSLISSIKSKSDSKSIPEASEYSKYSENIVSDSDLRSIPEASDNSKSQVLENIVSIISSEKSDSVPKTIPEASEKSSPQVVENIDSLHSLAKSEIDTLEHKSISEFEETSEKTQIPESIDSLKSLVKSEINNVEHKLISEVKEASEKSDHQIPENIDSPISSAKSSDKSQLQENIVSEASTPKSENNSSISESPEKSVTQAQENIITSDESNKIESWEPQIISDIKSDSSEKEIKSRDTIKSEILEVNSAIPEKSSNTQSIIESKIFDEPETKSETRASEQNLQTDTGTPTPRSELHYETDFDKFSESDQSKIETESNVSLKETNVDSSINEDESEDHSENKTPVASIKSAEISTESKPEETSIKSAEISSENKPEETSIKSAEISSEDKPEETSIKSAEISSELKPEVTEENQDVLEASSKVTSESSGVSGHSTDTIKASPKDPESKIIPEEEKTAPEILETSESPEDDDLNDSKKGVSHIDVRKRVSEILADANGPRGDKSPRVQDLYTTTYDIPGSSESTPESGSPTNEFSKQEKASFSPETTPYINEAEELLRKQLEIEQEIKRLERQQQNIPYLFMREIPNKPPPPYKPPDFPLTPVIASIIPSKPEQTKKIINDATEILYGAYSTGGDLMKTSSETKDDQQKFMFDLCKEIAIEACKPTIETKIPSWRSQKNKFQNLFAKRPITKDNLNSVLNKKVLQLLNFEPVARNDSLIIRWSRKKRDHVDEILVSETQAEEVEWTNFDSDEEIIKDNLTQSILDLLIVDAAKDVNDVLMTKKKLLSWSDC